MAQRRVARARVVDRDAQALRPQRRELVEQRQVAVDDRVLGHLDDELRQRQAVSEVGPARELEQRLRRDVQREKLARPEPRDDLPRFAYHEPFELET